MNLTIAITPGRMRGKSVAETNAVIIRGCQMWMKQCGLRFFTVGAGQPAHIHIGPTDKPFNGAMGALRGAVLGTGRIIYSTSLLFPNYWDAMAIAHEIAHIVGWNHTPNNAGYREYMMHPGGSKLFYFEPREAKRSELQFGRPSAYHWPDSLWHVGEKIRSAKKAFQTANSDWQNATKVMNDLIATRNAETNVDRRQRLNGLIKVQSDKRIAADKQRRSANDSLRVETQNWQRIKKTWDSAVWNAASRLVSSSDDFDASPKPCACFSQLVPQTIGGSIVDLQSLFDELTQMPTEPLPGLEIKTEIKSLEIQS